MGWLKEQVEQLVYAASSSLRHEQQAYSTCDWTWLRSICRRFPVMELHSGAGPARSSADGCAKTIYPSCFDASVAWISFLLLSMRNTSRSSQIPSAPASGCALYLIRRRSPVSERQLSDADSGIPYSCGP